MKIQTLLKSIFSSAIIALLLSMMSCDTANPSALVGQWIAVSGKDKGNIMELSSDGTGVLGFNGIEITWKTESGRFYITGSNKERSTSYKLQGSVLTFTEDNGKITEYTKCNKDCSEAAKEYIAAVLKAIKKGSFTDARDNKTYKTVKLDKQTWMAENLNYNADGSKCYENQESNCLKYGRLYDWSTAKSACPKSWHLPSNAEWQTIVDFLGGDKVAGNMLKASNGWDSSCVSWKSGSKRGDRFCAEKGNGNGDDAIGFSALPGGNIFYDKFSSIGGGGYWWSGSEVGVGYWIMYSDSKAAKYYNGEHGLLLSVRCVQD